MPVMNGFEAARRIRDAEAGFRSALPPLVTPAAAMIIALTGLASGRDQSEAFTSGFDLYLVKPISFKSVAKLLDSWERNGGAATVAGGGSSSGGSITGVSATGVAVGVPHGPLSSKDVAALSVGSESFAGGVGGGAASGGDGGYDTLTDDEYDEDDDNDDLYL